MKQKKTVQNDAEQLLAPPLLPLLHSFCAIAGIQMKMCARDGKLLPAFSSAPSLGPCALFQTEGKLSENCALSHAGAIELARLLKKPYIFTCHTHLVAWAIPILHESGAQDAVIICGGVLLKEPDAALVNHLEGVAKTNGIEPDVLIRSLDELPVVSRDYFRAAAGFIFDLIHAFVLLTAATPADAPAAPPAFYFMQQPQLPLIFPPQRRKEQKRERERKSLRIQKEHAEKEIVRFLRDRRHDEAMSSLLGLLKKEDSAGEPEAPHKNAAEVFARLFRAISDNRRPHQNLQEQQAALLKEALGLTRGPEGKKKLLRLCEDFISVANEMIGGPRPRELKKVQKYLEKNLSKKLTLGTVGKRFAMREKPLNELILRNCGMSFTDYVILLRIEEAKRLLQTTQLNLGEIAKETGFSDQSYFTKVFKATAGMNPSEYRNR
jgi:two-component system response regulator YesN